MSAKQVSQNIVDFRTGKVSERSWLLTCLILLEGADIPEADTVALVAPWKTEVRLIQLLLRPGRWYPKKTSFNIVVSSDEDHLIEDMLRIAGFEITDDKTRHLRAATQETTDEPSDPEVAHVETHSEVATQETTDEPSDLEVARDKTHPEVVTQETTGGPSGVDIVRTSGHIRCGSFGKSTSTADNFWTTFENSPVVTTKQDMSKWSLGDIVIVMGSSHVAFAYVTGFSRAGEISSDGKVTRKTSLDVEWLSVKWEPQTVAGAAGSIDTSDDDTDGLLTVEQFRECIEEMWGDREDKDQICKPDSSEACLYETERRALMLRVIDRRY
jgi:hypothetical protein